MEVISKTGYSIKWNAILVVSQKLVVLLTGIILARLLTPEDFGVVAMVNVFIGILAVFVNSGTGSSIIQKTSLSQVDLSTIFYFNISVGFSVSLLLFLSAVQISQFYDNQKLVAITKIVAWKPFIDSLSIVHQFLMVRNIDLKKRTLAQLLGQIFAGVLGIVLAFSGFGVYALVWATISSSIVSAGLFWLQSSWTPALVFSFGRLKRIWQYSGKILYTNILLQVAGRIDELIVGKFVSTASLGLYNRGKSLSTIPTNMFGQVLTRSFFPILSKLQHEKGQLISYFEKQSDRIAWLTIPVYILLVVVAEDLVVVLLGVKWQGTVFFFRLALVADFLYANNVLKVYVINAIGKPHLNLKRGAVLIPLRIFFFTVPVLLQLEFLPEYLLVVTIFFYLASFIWLSISIQKQLKTSVTRQLGTFIKYIIIAAACSVLVLIFSLKSQYPLVNLTMGVIVFMISYCTILWMYRDQHLMSLLIRVNGYYNEFLTR